MRTGAILYIIMLGISPLYGSSLIPKATRITEANGNSIAYDKITGELNTFAKIGWFQCETDGVRYTITQPMAIKSQLLSLAIVQVNGAHYLRSIYRTSKYFVWRSPSHLALFFYYGKGYGEGDTDLPFDTQQCIASHIDPDQVLHRSGLQKRLFHKLWKRGLQKTFRFRYPKTYKRVVKPQVHLLRGRRLKDKNLHYKDPLDAPNFHNTWSCYDQIDFNRHMARIQSCIVPSHNKKIHYLFGKNKTDIWLSSAEFSDSDITRWGNRNVSPNIGPLFEYHTQYQPTFELSSRYKVVRRVFSNLQASDIFR